ncbi:hypothetical protein [Bradyrhizobium paxllaeri]|uniref:hypothetical protein n=1 Tax=Bradyrhizobium paxllaeri TaxID=190148 RepID=UPI00165255B9|nr:hypothetical protein [Bradyrhizobium paxllaeri]
MTYLARIPQKALPVLRLEFAQMLIAKPEQDGSERSRGIVHRGGAGNRHEGERRA